MAGDPRPRPKIAAVGGFTPQANRLLPLRGSGGAPPGVFAAERRNDACDGAPEGFQRASGLVCDGAPEARQMDSPGREPRILRSASAQSRRQPRVRGTQPMIEPPEGATDQLVSIPCGAGVSPAHRRGSPRCAAGTAAPQNRLHPLRARASRWGWWGQIPNSEFRIPNSELNLLP